MPGQARKISRPPSIGRAFSIGLAAALAASASPADAAETPVFRQSSVGVDLRYWSSERGGSVFPIAPFFHYEVFSNIFVDAELAIAPQSGGRNFQDPAKDEAISRFGLGNPMIGAHYAATPGGSGVTYLAGIRIGIPLASVADSASDRANDLASATSAHYRFYRWVPELFPLVGTIGIEARPTRGLWIRAPLEAIALVATSDRRENHFGFSGRFEVEGQSRAGFGGGAALQLVISDGFRTREEDRAQVALDPYFLFDNDRIFVRAGTLLALDNPLGPGFFEEGVLTLHMSIGGHLK